MGLLKDWKKGYSSACDQLILERPERYERYHRKLNQEIQAKIADEKM